MPSKSPFTAKNLDTSFKLAGGLAGLWALQSRILKLQIECARQGQKLALTALDRTSAVWTPLLLAALRRPWAR